jgi:hypothetical protein
LASITVPTSGDPITATYGAAVARSVNLGTITLSADVTTSSGSFGNLTGLSFTCVATVNGAGNTYFIRAWGRYVCTADGTFTLRHMRNTTGTLTIHKGSALRAVSDG